MSRTPRKKLIKENPKAEPREFLLAADAAGGQVQRELINLHLMEKFSESLKLSPKRKIKKT